MLESLRNKRILLVVAHPDDEVLGVGSTMNLLISDYDCTVHTVILGEGLTSRTDKRDSVNWQNEIDLHRANALQAQREIGFQSIKLYDFPDNRFDSVALLDIIKVIEHEKASFRPDVVFTHHGGDVNVDHQRTFEAVITSTRPMQDEKVKMIFTFETMSGTEWRASTDPRHFIPNVFFEISEKNLLAKSKAMEAYKFEKRPYPHPRSPEALRIRAQMWGMANGMAYAEAFCLVRSR